MAQPPPVLNVAMPSHPRAHKLLSPVSTLNEQHLMMTQRSATDAPQLSQIANHKELIPSFGIQVFNHNKQRVVNMKPKKRRLIS